jgi:uridine kinase
VTPEALVRLLWSRSPSAGGTRVLAIDGPSGSGKTTLASALRDVLGPVPVVHMDDLYPGWDGLEEAVPRLVHDVLEPLSRGAPGRYRRYDWPTGRYAEAHEVPAGETVVVEGVGSGATPCAPYLALLVWVEAPRDVRFARGVERGGEAYRPHWERWAAQEEQHFRLGRTRERADVVLQGVPEDDVRVSQFAP